jgi:PKD repeat protein
MKLALPVFRPVLFVALVLGFTQRADAQIPAFPGAVGFGAGSVGGRGGTVLFVTNLNNSGPGSLRTALEASGRRIIVFRVGGTITLGAEITVENPFLTIAGQTAPGDGICVRGNKINIKTHDVIIRGMRLRPGDLAPIDDNAKGILVQEGAYNVILDHCSISWSVDMLFATWNSYGSLTVQNCILSEALDRPDNPHPSTGMGMTTGPADPDSTPYYGHATLYANYIAHSLGRNPRIKDSPTEVVNMLVYNYKTDRCLTNAGALLDYIGNHSIPGPNSGNSATLRIIEPTSATRVYVSDNIAPERPDNTGDEWLIVEGSTSYRSFARLHSSSLVPMPVEQVMDYVTANAGARPRDAVDNRIVRDVYQRTGALIYSQNDVGGWPTLNAGVAPVDTDNDGMPDDWETANGTNRLVADANGDLDGDGYKNIEEYINSLIVAQPTIAYAGTDQDVCGTTTTLGANTPQLGTGTWRVISGTGTFAAPNNPTSSVTGLLPGMNQFEWRINYGSTVSRDTVEITAFIPPTISNAGPDQVLCNVTSTTLAGNAPAVGTGVWTLVSGSGSITDPSNRLTQVTGLSSGTIKFAWTITAAGPCPASRDTVSIIISALPSTANAGSDKTVCNTTTTNLSATNPAIGDGIWRTVFGPAVVTTPTNRASGVTGLQIGENKFEWTVSNGSCSPSRDTVTVTRANSPTSDFTWAINGLTVNFTTLSTNAVTYYWGFADGTTSNLPNPTHTYATARSYRVTHTASNTCGNATRRRRITLTGLTGVLSVSPTEVDFGSSPAGSQQTLPLSLTNIGADTVDIEAVSMNDNPTAVFSVVFDTCSLGPENGTNFELVFEPDTAGEFACVVAISANDTTVYVNASGSSYEIMADPPHTESVQGTPVFGDVPIGSSVVRRVTLGTVLEGRRIDSVAVASTGGVFGVASVLVRRELTERSPSRERQVAGPPLREDGETIVTAGSQTYVPKLPLSVVALPMLAGSGDSLFVDVRYAPVAERADDASLILFTDQGEYRIAVGGTGVAAGSDNGDRMGEGIVSQAIPEKFDLMQNYPNPFNNSTVIRYAVAVESPVSIRIFSMLGEEVATLVDDNKPAGYWEVEWNGRNTTGNVVSSGVYLMRMSAGDVVQTRRLMMLR